MSEKHREKESRDEQFAQIIADFLDAEIAGQAPDREAILKANPGLADELNAFFADHDRMNSLAEPVRRLDRDEVTPAFDAPTLPPDSRSSFPDDATLPPNQSPDTIAETKGEPPRPGTIIRYFGDYELLEEIARGGMGVVYKARQIKLNRIVALKMILAGQLASKEDVQRFHTEAEAAANLDHQGIVPIFEVGEHEGQHYFSMGYIDGDSLAGKLLDGPLPPRKAAKLIHAVAAAVQYAHQKGVIHRDLKPANILLTRGGRPKVTDFGLAKQVKGDSGLTATGQILGTPSYMPPEQASGRVNEVCEVSDVYALGAVLYATLTGRPPFQTDNPLDTLMQVLEREPVSPQQLNPAVPSDLETICLKCLEKDRRKRYSSAKRLCDELRRFLEGRPIVARPISRPARGWRWCKRNPVVSSLLAVVAVSMIVGTSISSHYAVLANERADVAVREKDRADENATKALSSADEERKAKNAEADARRKAQILAEAEAAARIDEQKQRRRAETMAAEMLLNRGIESCEKGDIAVGMLWFARVLRDGCACSVISWLRRPNESQQLETQTGVTRNVASNSGRSLWTLSRRKPGSHQNWQPGPALECEIGRADR